MRHRLLSPNATVLVLHPSATVHVCSVSSPTAIAVDLQFLIYTWCSAIFLDPSANRLCLVGFSLLAGGRHNCRFYTGHCSGFSIFVLLAPVHHGSNISLNSFANNEDLFHTRGHLPSRSIVCLLVTRIINSISRNRVLDTCRARYLWLWSRGPIRLYGRMLRPIASFCWLCHAE